MIILVVAIATFATPYADSAAMFPFTFRIPNQNHSEVSSMVMVPAIGPIPSEGQILRSIFDRFSFWTGTQAVKLDSLNDLQSTNFMSSLVTTVPAEAAEKPTEQAADNAKVTETTGAEAEEVKPNAEAASDIATSDAVVASTEATSVPAVASDEAQPVPVTDIPDAPTNNSKSLNEIPTTDVPLTVESAPELLQVVADEEEVIVESVEQASESPKVASDLGLSTEQQFVTESTLGAANTSAVEFLEDLNKLSFDFASIEQIPDTRGFSHPSHKKPTPYSPTCAFIPNASFIGFTLYTLINIGSPFQCGNIHCAADWQCTHWNWYPTNKGTCEIKSNPGSGWTWATPSPPSHIPRPTKWCGVIPKRACPPALISICIYIDIILSI